MNNMNKQYKPRQKKITVITKDGQELQLTPNQKAYADLKAQFPNRSLASIAAEVYPNAQPETVSQIVNQNEKNTSISLYSNDQVNNAKSTVLEIMGDKNNKARDRLTAAFDVMDRNLGKAIQKTEVSSTSLNINIDLSGLAEAAESQES